MIKNPFLVAGYESPRYFCDRKKETEELSNALRNGRNVTLTSPRRMGKTGLILHLFHLIKEEEPKSAVIYVDLYSTESLADFTKVFASAVINQLESNPMRILKTAASVVKGLRPTLTMDELTGKPKISVDITGGDEDYSLEQAFQYIQRSGKTCYIAMDEFQQIANYPETTVEAFLRGRIQNLHNAHFIFSGSQEHMLREMFLSPKRPFYLSTSLKSIGPIDEDDYFAFARGFFEEQGRDLPQEVFHRVYQNYEGHTWFIQMVMNRLYANPARVIDDSLVQRCVLEILKENEYYYQSLLRAYSKGQAKLMRAIAREGKVKELTAGSFIMNHKLTAVSSVKSALTRLLDDEVIYRADEGYMIYDRFFGEWLRKDI
ncbi:MAG: ATP-binding protein [Bacteroidales bacterium]|nr:ATP-binding protein [Bacteroidales bacterium]